MYHVFRVRVEDSVGFLKVSVPFSTRESAEEYAARQRESHPATWPVTIVEQDENVPPLR